MKKPKIQSITDQRPFAIVYHDSMKSELLDTPYQKLIYIYLKMFADSNNQCYPSAKKLSKLTKIGISKVKTTINELEQKNIITKENRIKSNGGKTSNLYTLHDFRELWNVENNTETKQIINQEREKKAIELLESIGYTITKEKGLTSEPTKVTDVSTQKNKLSLQEQNTTPVPKSQELERYTLDQIKQLFDYDIMIQDNPYKQQDIDSVMDILHTTMNTTKETLRVNGENKPSMVVISKLMKLNKESIIYAINKFAEQTDRIKNTTAYMLTILYNAPEQFNLDMQNQIQHNVNNWNNKDVEYQRYNYNELEKQLLS